MMLSSLPSDVNGWTPKQADDVYTYDTLFKYIDGAAEVYRSFNVREVVARRYAKPGAPEIIADVFDMGAPADAYGVYHHDYREGPASNLGEESEYIEGALAFWRGRFFISIMTMEETPESKDAVIQLGRLIDAGLPREGSKPRIMNLLPQEDLLPRHVYYFHDHYCLNAHYFVAEDNLLDLGKDTEGALARYAVKGGAANDFYLLAILKYPNAGRAAAACAKFKAGYIPEAGAEPFAKLENGKWAGAKTLDNYVLAAFEAPTREVAESILSKSEASINSQKEKR